LPRVRINTFFKDRYMKIEQILHTMNIVRIKMKSLVSILTNSRGYKGRVFLLLSQKALWEW
jgi:hypothetical protein